MKPFSEVFFLPGFVRIRTWFGSTPFRIVQKRSKHKRLTPLVKLTFFLPKLPRSFVWATKNRIHSQRLGAFTRGAETSLPQTLVVTALSAGSFLSWNTTCVSTNSVGIPHKKNLRRIDSLGEKKSQILSCSYKIRLPSELEMVKVGYTNLLLCSSVVFWRNTSPPPLPHTSILKNIYIDQNDWQRGLTSTYKKTPQQSES